MYAHSTTRRGQDGRAMSGSPPRVNLFYIVLFFYFFLLSADVLHIEVGLFKIKVGNLVGALACLSLFVTSRGLLLVKESLLPLGALFVSLFVSSLLSVHMERCLGYCVVYLFTVVVYFFLPYTFFFSFDRNRVLKVYFLSFQLMGVYAIVQLALSIGGIYTPLLRQWIEQGGWARPHALSYEPSFYALYMCGFVMFYNALYFLNGEKKSVLKLVAVNGLLLVSTSTSGFFAYFFFFPLIFFLRRYAVEFKKKIGLFIGVLSAFLLCIAGVAPKITLFFVKFFVVDFFSHHSFSERWEGIKNAWGVFLEHPLLGVGIGGIGPYLYAREKGGVILSNAFGMTLQEVELYDPKNVTTEILAGLGVLGVIPFCLLALWVTKSFKRVFALEGQERSIALSLFISLFVMILVLQFNSGLFRCYIWVHAAVTIGYTESLLSKLQRSGMLSCAFPSFPSCASSILK